VTEGIPVNGFRIWFSGLWLFVLLLVLGPPALALAESNPKINWTDIERLQQITQRLQQLNAELTQKLQQSNKDLASTQAELANYKAELDNVTSQLTEAQTTVDTYKQELMEVQQLLMATNQKMAEYQKKVEKEIRSLKLQRSIAGLVAVLVLILK
jgi:septal ring factor EnvC (AmiA/AmiB activator)